MLVKLIDWLPKLWGKVRDYFSTELHVVEIRGDFLPDEIRPKQFIHLLDEGESWSAGFRCPCGCGDVLEIALLDDAEPRWRLQVDHRGRPTLFPSVWRNDGCRSHFWIKKGKVHWC
ncbi:DUF6527 family protein [Pseudomonas sp. IT-P291]|uniref:DUF6527 family protein n=1 Tax=Pseudomonas sp. IT-P291 TaxID=3026448 RepID=UPI0039E069AD